MDYCLYLNPSTLAKYSYKPNQDEGNKVASLVSDTLIDLKSGDNKQKVPANESPDKVIKS